MLTKMFGEYFRELRLTRNLSLRAYCEGAGEDPGYISRLERGLLGPPKDAGVLTRLARSLGLSGDSAEWKEFHRLAAIGAGRIPADIMKDEELVKHLPLFFRTISGEQFPDEKLDELIDYVKAVNSAGPLEEKTSKNKKG
jgi:transcriptional regulator with XRE-family HTH domain